MAEDKSKYHSYLQTGQEGRPRKLQAISLTLIHGQVIEQLMLETIYTHMNKGKLTWPAKIHRREVMIKQLDKFLQ